MKWPKLVPPGRCRTLVHVTLFHEGVDADGAPAAALDADLRCNWQDSAKTVRTSETATQRLTASLYFDGDIAPALAAISGGTVTAFGMERTIVRGVKARNPDGTVNYTQLDVI